MNIDETSKRDTIHLRVCCKDWETVRSTVRMPLDSSGEQELDTIGCVVDFPALTSGQWEFLQPELDRLGVPYDFIDHANDSARWITQLTSCK